MQSFLYSMILFFSIEYELILSFSFSKFLNNSSKLRFILPSGLYYKQRFRVSKSAVYNRERVKVHTF